MTQDGADVM
jgi:hypothetical protein